MQVCKRDFAKLLLQWPTNNRETGFQSGRNETLNPVKHKLRHWIIVSLCGFTLLELSSLILLMSNVSTLCFCQLKPVLALVGHLRHVDQIKKHLQEQKARSRLLGNFVWEWSVLFLLNRSHFAPPACEGQTSGYKSTRRHRCSLSLV